MRQIRPAAIIDRSRDRDFMREALALAAQGAALGEVPVGAVLVQDGEIIGRGFGPDEITDAIETVVETYLAHRLNADEKFLDAYRRLGAAPFKDVLYAQSVEASLTNATL